MYAIPLIHWLQICYILLTLLTLCNLWPAQDVKNHTLDQVLFFGLLLSNAWHLCVWPQGYFIWHRASSIHTKTASLPYYQLYYTHPVFQCLLCRFHSPCYWILLHPFKHWRINRPLPQVLFVYPRLRCRSCKRKDRAFSVAAPRLWKTLP